MSPRSREIRPDIVGAYSSLFGLQSVKGRSVSVEETIARLTNETRQVFHNLLQKRHAMQARVGRKEAEYDFLDPRTTVLDVDGNCATVAEIRKGMLARGVEGECPGPDSSRHHATGP